jgi:dienelactone hydrolase
MRHAVLVVLVVLAAAAAGTALAAGSPFAYETSRPLSFEDAGRVNSNYPIRIDAVSYASGGARVDAFLAVPPGSARRAAVVYVHGSGGDRRQLLVPAVWLAGRGAVTLSITAPSAGAKLPAGLSAVAKLEWERDLAVKDVVAVRRAVDLLRGRRDVDPRRIGYVGWSAGAKTGALLAGAEPRLRALVLMSGGSPPVSAYVGRAPARLRADVRRLLGPVDPLLWIARARPGSLFLQDGTKDTVVPHWALVGLAQAAPERTKLVWYTAGHALNSEAYRDQLAWLAGTLRVGPRVAGAQTAP